MATGSARAGENHPHEVRIAFDGDAVLFADEAEQVLQKRGLAAFQAHEKRKAELPLPDGPFKPLLTALHRLQGAGSQADAAAHVARSRRAVRQPMSAPSAR